MSDNEIEEKLSAVNENTAKLERTRNNLERELQNELQQGTQERSPETGSEHVGSRKDSREAKRQCACFTIGTAPETGNLTLLHDSATSWLAATSSNDGRHQVLCFIDDSGKEDIEIRVETWIMDVLINDMKLLNKVNITANKTDSLYTWFGAPHEQHHALIPKRAQGLRPDFVSLGLGGNLLHVGCRSYMVGENQGKQSYSLLDFKSAESSDSYFEESCQQGSIVILARRRQLKSIEGDLPMSASEHGARMRRIRDSNRRMFSRFDRYEDPFDDSINVSGNQMDSETSSLADMVDSEMRSESDESLPMYQSTSETDSDISDLVSCSSSEDNNMQQLAPGDSESEDFDETGTEGGDEDDMSSLRSAPGPNSSDVDSDDGSGLSPSPSFASDIDQDDDVEYFHYLLRIMPGRRWVRCAGCGSHPLETWYHCAICEPDRGFDLCFECLQKSFWCYDQAHSLYECGQSGRRGVITWSTYLLEQDFRVFDLAEGSPKELFAWKASEQELLHESPPVIAPHKTLAVWPVSQDSLLFVNYERGQSREHRVRVRSGKAHLLSMDLHFSDCGRYLYVAHAEAERLFNKKSSAKSENPHTYALTFVLTTLRIASEPPFIGRPQKVSRISHSIETPEKLYSPVVPYTWTWCPADVYLCLSGSTLRVYKISLAQPDGDVNKNLTVKTPSQTIRLPCSAQACSVQFFPSQSPGATSTVIVGPHYEAKTSLPISMHLKDEDLGNWISAQDENHTNALKTLRSLPDKGFVAVSLAGVSHPLVTLPHQTLEATEDPNADISHDVLCDGAPCRDLDVKQSRIWGIRFKCLSCDNIDFCQNCISGVHNQHDVTHIMLLLPRPVECHIKVPEKRIGKSTDEKVELNWELLEAEAFAKICWVCSLIWSAFSQLLSPDEWQFVKRERKIEVAHSAVNCLQIAVKDGRPDYRGNAQRPNLGADEPAQSDRNPQLAGYKFKVEKMKHHLAEIVWNIKQPRIKPDQKNDPIPIVRKVVARPDSEAGLEIARHWLAACIECHADCVHSQSSLSPSKLILLPKDGDSKILIVDGADISDPYAALSYCWGFDPNPVQTTRENLQTYREQGLIVEDLPAAIRDAVKVAAALEFKYIWIDRFCIVQDDDDDWVRESANMCNIYSNALLTISADRSASAWETFLNRQACADDRHVSLFAGFLLQLENHHQRLDGLYSLDTDKTQPNHRRAWTMQERLMSPRVLHFTSNELIWECDSIIQCECGRETRRADRRSSFLQLSKDPHDWHSTVSDYTARALKNHSDKYMAIEGLSTRFKTLDTGLQTDAGTYIGGLWFKNLAADLAWLSPSPKKWNTWLQNNQDHNPATLITHEDTADAPVETLQKYMSMQAKIPGNRRPSEPLYPTWTWASLRGPVEYYYSRPRGEHYSFVDLVHSQIIAPDPQKSLGHALFGSTLTLRSHAIGSNCTTNKLKLWAWTAGHESRSGSKNETVVKEHTWLMYKDHEASITIYFHPDDPVTAVKKYGRHGGINAMCMLLGAYAIPSYTGSESSIPGLPHRGLYIQGLPTETFTRTKVSSSQSSAAADVSTESGESTRVWLRPESKGSKKIREAFEAIASALDSQKVSSGNLPTGASDNPANPTSLEPLRHYSASDNPISKLYNGFDPKNVYGYEAFYLVLVPSEAHPGAWERVGCLQAGLFPDAREIMAELFQKIGRQEDVVLV